MTEEYSGTYEDYEDYEETAPSGIPQTAPVSSRPTSLLSIDVGSVNTSSLLFDVVEGRYRFLAAGSAPSTANPPMSDASEGVRMALDTLYAISGRAMTARDEQLIIPSLPDGSGADNLAVTYSAGEPLKAVVVGLLDKVSLQSALNLANSSYTEVVATISVGNEERVEEQIDNILRLQPDVVIVAGGTNNGATRSVFKMINTLGMALFLMPDGYRPEVLYAGNPQLTEQVKAFMQRLGTVHMASNIRPSLSVEQLGPAQTKLNQIFNNIHSTRTLGVGELNGWSGGFMIPTAHAFGRVLRFFSKIVPGAASHGVLGVDVGACTTTVAASFNGDLRQRVINRLGSGRGLKTILENSRLDDILRWLPLDVPGGYVVDYIQNKTIHPEVLPATREDMAIEQALARVIIQRAMSEARSQFPKNVERIEPGLLPNFDPILVSGRVIANAPTTAQSLLMILDALQPTGIQQIILDKNNLAAALGAAIPINPTLVAQLLLDPISFLNLGFVISPVSRARPGSPVLRIRIEYEAGHENTITVNSGTIVKIPLPLGRRAKLFIDPLQRANLGRGPGRSLPGKRVVGGPFGVVVDARGRPIQLDNNPERRRENHRRWLKMVERGR